MIVFQSLLFGLLHCLSDNHLFFLSFFQLLIGYGYFKIFITSPLFSTRLFDSAFFNLVSRKRFHVIIFII
ncbi:hypothetical protein HanIR_Chr08g0351101 [Helianthus annuus]|nr:hypothetical protein HanIR_Chr08g0351101 [Helianthus annuus]